MTDLKPSIILFAVLKHFFDDGSRFFSKARNYCKNQFRVKSEITYLYLPEAYIVANSFVCAELVFYLYTKY
jgi:phosphatidylinositol kinase/protein kinase (PI-3  family)